MTADEAREALRFHACQHDDVGDPRWAHGFLGSLRPFHGLREHNFHEVMEALRALAPALQEARVERDVVANLVGICHLGRAWGVAAGGMLRRNRLIADDDVHRLDDWVHTLSDAISCVLDGAVDEAFLAYDRSRGGTR